MAWNQRSALHAVTLSRPIRRPARLEAAPADRAVHSTQAPSLCSRRMSSEAAAATPRVLVPIATGSEEIESVCIIDVLRRAGADVTVASVMPDKTVVCSRGVVITADALISECKDKSFDLVALPGGMPGAEHLRDSAELTAIVTAMAADEDKFVSAICAAPAVALKAHGILDGVSDATCHPNFVDQLAGKGSVDSRVVVSGKVVTSRGPGTAIEFALQLVECLFGADKAKTVAAPMVVPE